MPDLDVLLRNDMKGITLITALFVCLSLGYVSASPKLPQTPFKRFVGSWVESGHGDGGKGDATPPEKWTGKFSDNHSEFIIAYEDGRQWIFSSSAEKGKFIARFSTSEKQKLLGTWNEKTDILEWRGKDSYGRDKVIRIHLADNANIKSTVILKDADGRMVFHWVGVSKKTKQIDNL